LLTRAAHEQPDNTPVDCSHARRMFTPGSRYDRFFLTSQDGEVR